MRLGTVGIVLIGALAGVAIICFSITNLHSDMDDLQATIALNQKVLAEQEHALKELMAMTERGHAGLKALNTQIAKGGNSEEQISNMLLHLQSRWDEESQAAATHRKDEERMNKALETAVQRANQRSDASNQKLEGLEAAVNKMMQEAATHGKRRDRIEELMTNLTAKVHKSGLGMGAAQAMAPAPPPVAAAPTPAPPPPSAQASAAADDLEDDDIPAATGAREKVRTSTTQKLQHLKSAAGAKATSRPKQSYEVAWYRECGCTGMEVEATTLLVGLAKRIGPDRIRTNKCTSSCDWPQDVQRVLQQISVADDRRLWPRNAEDRPAAGTLFVLVVHAAFAGVCGTPDGLGLPYRSHNDALVESGGRMFRVSRSMMETDSVNTFSAQSCNEQFDAVWVPSAFNQNTFKKAGVKADMISILHEAVDTASFKCKHAKDDKDKESDDDEAEDAGESGESHFGDQAGGKGDGSDNGDDADLFGVDQLDDFMAEAGPDDFIFLSVFKWESRKNWLALLKTFFAAFPEKETTISVKKAAASGHEADSEAEEADGSDETRTVRARLLIKTQRLDWASDPSEDLLMFLDSAGISHNDVKGRLLIFMDPLPSSKMPLLYQRADAFVLPSHGEGWGLPIAEAMATGLPTIATGWGGQTEFMNSGNSFPLGYKLETADDAQSFGERPQKWASVDLDDLKSAMHEVAARTPESISKGKQACKDMRSSYTPSFVAGKLDDLLSGLGTKVI